MDKWGSLFGLCDILERWLASSAITFLGLLIAVIGFTDTARAIQTLTDNYLRRGLISIGNYAASLFDAGQHRISEAFIAWRRDKRIDLWITKFPASHPEKYFFLLDANAQTIRDVSPFKRRAFKQAMQERLMAVAELDEATPDYSELDALKWRIQEIEANLRQGPPTLDGILNFFAIVAIVLTMLFGGPLFASFLVLYFAVYLFWGVIYLAALVFVFVIGETIALLALFLATACLRVLSWSTNAFLGLLSRPPGGITGTFGLLLAAVPFLQSFSCY